MANSRSSAYQPAEAKAILGAISHLENITMWKIVDQEIWQYLKRLSEGNRDIAKLLSGDGEH